jgi:hypothetical protein
MLVDLDWDLDHFVERQGVTHQVRPDDDEQEGDPGASPEGP